MLNAFVSLRDQPDSAILKFAKRWGVFGPPMTGRLDAESRPHWVYGSCGAETLGSWRYFSRRAGAVLNVAAKLQQGKIGDVGDWLQLKEPFNLGRDDTPENKLFQPRIEAVPDSLSQARHLIADEVQGWLDLPHHFTEFGCSDFRIHTTPDGRWELKIDHHGFLLPALAFQLALVVVDADSLYCCSECGKPYIRPRTTRAPNPGKANYCPKCTDIGIPTRRAGKRQREKMQQAKTLHHQGKTVREIAQELGVRKTASVQRWLKTTTR
jgi:hypothetical protein